MIGDSFELGDEIDQEHRRLDQPAFTALMHRTFPNYTEVMWIQGYPGQRLIVVTCPEVNIPTDEYGNPMCLIFPGTVVERPVGWRDMATAETFRARCEQTVAIYESVKWVRKPIDVRTEEAR